MTQVLIEQYATVKVPDHRNLLAAWRLYGGPGSLVGTFIVGEPLTASQLRRLPAALRERLKAQQN